MKKIVAAIFLALALTTLTGCPSVPTAAGPVLDNDAAQRAVFDAEGKYRLALIAAKAYVSLPLCDKVQPPCATLGVVRQIQSSQKVARSALDSAESTVRNPSFGADVMNSAVIAGTAALRAFESVANTPATK